MIRLPFPKHLTLLKERLKFFLERQFVKGTRYQFLFVAALVGLISVIGGVLVLGTGDPQQNVADSIWWAFLRLTDPGYLGDDEGAWRRIVSTLLTVSGYVVFMGALIAIMTRWLISRMQELERGLTPVAIRNHIVVVGWTSRTLPVLRELLLSGGHIKRFLAEIGGRKRLRLVVLADDITAERAHALRIDPVIGKRVNDIILRSGSALKAEHLHRIACIHAAAVILPGRSFESESLITSDVETIKALLSMDGQARGAGTELPYVVAEIQDLWQMRVARRAYSGPLEVVAGNSAISRLMVQNIRHPGLSCVYTELLSHAIGNDLYIRQHDALAGHTLRAAAALFQSAILCGVVRGEADSITPYLNPPATFRIEPGDKLVLLARSYEQTTPATDPVAEPQLSESAVAPTLDPGTTVLPGRDVLILGWSRKVPALLQEFATYSDEAFQLTVVSSRPIAERVQALEEYGLSVDAAVCRHIEADYAIERELRTVDIARYDSIILMSSDRLGSGEEADARSIVGYLLLEEMLEEQRRQPQILLELSDHHNALLMGQRTGEVIVSPLLLSHLLAQVALRRELRVVFEELFTAGGAEISFRDPADYGVGNGDTTFGEIERRAWRAGETALGIYRRTTTSISRGQLVLNPDRHAQLPLNAADILVVLHTS
ncbi:MAG: hypothetical protein WED00_05185 [Aquisalimonadaceae bacterium]